MLLHSIFGEYGAASAALVFLWCAAAICGQRLHDCNRSAWYLLLILIPVLGPLILLSLLARKGAGEKNIYGPAPDKREDYLQVDISA